MNIFEEKFLDDKILKAVSDLGFTEPTPIQQETIPLILDTKQDLIALAQTGTGKTAGFGLPIIQQIEYSQKNPQTLILSPTRELAIQITNDLKTYSKYLKGLKIEAVYGGASIMPQISSLKKGVHIVVGTPGRTLDLIKRKALIIKDIRWLILDEADEMLNMGFKEELDEILKNTPEEKQTLLFSATMPSDVRYIANNYLKKPKEISAGEKNIGAENVEHHYYVVRAGDRYIALKRLADYHPKIYGIVFCRTRNETKTVANKLMEDGYNADALHGDLSQAQRDYVMQRFRTKQLQLLVATDVAARGLDINNLTHIINYNLPDDPEIYIHRSGRTGRAGKKGISVIITHSREGKKINNLEKIVGKNFYKKEIPSGQEICEKRLFNLIDKIENTIVDKDKIAPYLDTINKKLQWLDRDELLQRFVFVEFEDFLNYYKDDRNLNVAQDNSKNTNLSKKDKRKDKSNNFVRLFINIGTKQHLKVANLIGLINELTNSNNINIGKIEIQKSFSFFEIQKGKEFSVIEAFRNKNFGSTKLNVEISKPIKKKRKRRRH